MSFASYPVDYRPKEIITSPKAEVLVRLEAILLQVNLM